jgi:flavin-dependent dehydrogenase
MKGTALRGVERTGDGWLLRLSTGESLFSRFVVDATGAHALFARKAGARLVNVDRLLGISRFFECTRPDPRVIVETFSDGWWYTAGLPNGKRITCCVTDADLAQRLKLCETSAWQRQLASTSTVAKLTDVGRPCNPIAVRSTSTRLLKPVTGRSWLAVGDAASRFDPLSSQGILKALRSGIFAAYAIGDWLLRGDESGLRRYQRHVMEEFRSYYEARSKYYREERRWAESQFWRRRHGDWRSEKLCTKSPL